MVVWRLNISFTLASSLNYISQCDNYTRFLWHWCYNAVHLAVESTNFLFSFLLIEELQIDINGLGPRLITWERTICPDILYKNFQPPFLYNGLNHFLGWCLGHWGSSWHCMCMYNTDHNWWSKMSTNVSLIKGSIEWSNG